jgi:hypothetical protein
LHVLGIVFSGILCWFRVFNLSFALGLVVVLL